MPQAITIDIERPEPGTAVIVLDGSFDVYSAPDVRAKLIDMLNEGRYRQVIDLREVALIDSTGLGVIVGALKNARGRGGNLSIITDLTGNVGHALRVTGVHKAIPHAENVEGALGLLAPKPERAGAPSPSAIAAQILQAQIRDLAREVFCDQVMARLDALVDSGEIRGLDEDALFALADAVERELLAAAEQDRITVTITEPTA